MIATRHIRPRALVVAFGIGLLAAATQSYSLKPYKWAKSQVTYYVNPANADVDEGSAEAAIRAGADAWALQSDANFSFAYAGRTSGSTVAANGINEVFFRPESNGSTVATTYWWYDGSGNLIEADIKFYDGGVNFCAGTTCTAGQYIRDIATHEFGHALGLNHSSITDATMYPSSPYCQQSWRTLSSDDIAGAETLYPPSTLASPPAAPSTLAAKRSTTSPSSAIVLSWSDNSSNEDRFLVERSGDGAIFTQIAQPGANVKTYTNSGLTASKTYWYRVRASNSVGFSSYSNVASASTAANSGPGVPSSPSPASNATGVSIDADLAWSCTGATSYNVYLGKSSTPPLYKSGLTTRSLVLPRLYRNTTYYWRVVAKDSYGSTSGPTWKFVTKK
jgi:hypothetical protein